MTTHSLNKPLRSLRQAEIDRVKATDYGAEVLAALKELRFTDPKHRDQVAGLHARIDLLLSEAERGARKGESDGR